MNAFLKLLAAATVVLLTGCASITGSQNQPISVRSSCGPTQQVSGAACRLSNDKGEWFVNSTPGTVTVKKAFGDVAIECAKPGLGSGSRVYKSNANGSVFGNLLAGGLVGYAVDAGTGAGFDYPQSMSVEICDGQYRAESDAKTAPTSKWLGLSEGFAKNSGCMTPATTAHVNTAWGAERYQYACTKRPVLFMECLNGWCKETTAF